MDTSVFGANHLDPLLQFLKFYSKFYLMEWPAWDRIGIEEKNIWYLLNEEKWGKMVYKTVETPDLKSISYVVCFEVMLSWENALV